MHCAFQEPLYSREESRGARARRSTRAEKGGASSSSVCGRRQALSTGREVLHCRTSDVLLLPAPCICQPSSSAPSPFSAEPPLPASPPTPMPNISDLPPELLHHILSLAHESTHWIPTPRRMPLLCSASLVCAAWAETTQRLMMECLTLEREGDVEKVRGKLRRRQVGALVRHLTDKTGQEGLRVVVEGARKVEHLCLMATEEKYDMDTVRMVLEKGA